MSTRSLLRRNLRRWLPFCATILFFLPRASAQEWTRFRGPNGTGIAIDADIPIKWGINDYRWRVELPGVGHSSPVVWADRLFVTSAREADGTQIVRCLRTSDGQLQWNREYPAEAGPKNKLNCYASSTPAVDRDRLYVCWATPQHHVVLALDRQSGKEIWRYELGPFAAEHGFGASPIVYRESLIVTNDQNGESSIVALDCATGKVRWKAPRRAERAAYSTPCLFQPAAGPDQLIVTSSANGFSSFDPADGKLNWELPLFRNRVVGSPLVAAGLVLASSGTGGAGRQMFAVRPGDPLHGTPPEKVFELTKTLPYVPTSVSDGRLTFLFGDQGVITCIKAATGKQVWQERLEAKFFGSPVRVGQRLYCIARDGRMIVLAAADRYRLLAQFDLGEASNSTPAISGGVMYLRTLSHVMAIGPQR